jgi:hypothetical protein
VEELVAAIEPQKGIHTAVIGGKKELLAMARGMSDGVAGAQTICRAGGQQLVRLHTVHVFTTTVN